MKGKELLIDIREEENKKRKAILKTEVLFKRSILKNSRVLLEEAREIVERAEKRVENATKEWEEVLQKDISEVELVERNRFPESYPGFPLIYRMPGERTSLFSNHHHYCRCTVAELVEEINFGHE